MKPFEILLTGVGGQGVLTMFKIIGDSANTIDLNVIGAETHGMSQRGGSVYVHLRISTDKIFSPLILEGQADIVVSLEPSEALRFAKYVKPNGYILTATNPIEPTNLTLTRTSYPDLSMILKSLKEYTQNVVQVDFNSLLDENVGIRSLNIAMIGLMSSVPNFPINIDVLKNFIKNRYPKHWNNNETAFNIGKEQFNFVITN